jgi:hypothetical protein
MVPSNDSDDWNQDKFNPIAFALNKEKPDGRILKMHGKCGHYTVPSAKAKLTTRSKKSDSGLVELQRFQRIPRRLPSCKSLKFGVIYSGATTFGK